jgi:hypothetical protein
MDCEQKLRLIKWAILSVVCLIIAIILVYYGSVDVTTATKVEKNQYALGSSSIFWLGFAGSVFKIWEEYEKQF